MSDFKDQFDLLPETKYITKHSNYFEVYDSHLHAYKGRDKVYVLEIGLLDGGSIELWSNFFGESLVFFGIDINPVCKSYARNNVNIYIGSQSDKEFLKKFLSEAPEFDVIIDDGGHTMQQQIISFEMLFPNLKHGGTYVCEDTHTSYWYPYGGGLKRKDSFIEYAKSMVDKLHAWHIPNYGEMDYYVENISSVHFYDSMVVFKKQKVTKPSVISKGAYSNTNNLYLRRRSKWFFMYHKALNRILAILGMKGYDYVYKD